MHRPVSRRTLFRLLGGSGIAAVYGAHSFAASRAANLIGPEHLNLSGDTTPAANVVTWRVLRGDIDTTGSGLLARAAGFVLPEDGPGLTVLDGSGTVLEVAEGGAAFVAEGAQQQYASTGPGQTQYLRIGLVALKDADFAADGKIVTQPPYPEILPPAEVRLDLYRVTIAAGEEWQLPSGMGWPLAIASGGSLKFVSGKTEVAIKRDKAQVLVSATPDIPWMARCPKGTDEAELILALLVDPAAPAPAVPSATPDATETAVATDPATAGGGVVTVRVLRCAAAEFDDTCLVRADAEEIERYRLVLIGPVNEDRGVRTDTVYYPISADSEQSQDGGFMFNVPSGLYEFGSRGEGSLPSQLDGRPYDGAPFDVDGEHLIEVVTPNWQ